MSDNPLETGTTVVGTVHRKKNKKKSKPNGVVNTTAAPDPNHRTISITLPKDVLEWYEKAAREAPFEPSVQKYIAWQLKGWAKSGATVLSLAEHEPKDPRPLIGSATVNVVND